MNNKQKFENFLESLKGNGQDSLIESVKSGFQACYESIFDGHGSDANKIAKGYLDAMFWTEEEETTKEKDFTDLAPETIKKIQRDVGKFYKMTQDLINALPTEYTDKYGYEQVGHDFWLTRNGHGSGFWDRQLGELGDKLTEIAETFGEATLYKGDDGKLYL